MCKFDHSLLILHKNFENSDCSMYAICGGLGKFCSQFALFTEKFTQSTKILRDCRSHRSRQISSLPPTTPTLTFHPPFSQTKLKFWVNHTSDPITVTSEKSKSKKSKSSSSTISATTVALFAAALQHFVL